MSLPDFDFSLSPDRLRSDVEDVIDRTIQLIEDLDETDLIGPYTPRLNPFLWEATHSLWFIERWTLRKFRDEPPYLEGVDDLYNSPEVRHGERWARDLVPFEDVRSFADDLKRRLGESLSDSTDKQYRYFLAYAVRHSDMHTEALTYQRQTRGLAPPTFLESDTTPTPDDSPEIAGDVTFCGETYFLGAEPSDAFLFDNERWAHAVDLDEFEMEKTPVTNAQYRNFVEDGGYRNQDVWSRAGWQWLQSSGLDSPLYWRNRDGQWEQRHFERWEPLSPDVPVTCVNYYEAQAYCNWADRRLPTEAEWERAASGGTSSSEEKRTYPWGDQMIDGRANLDWTEGGVVSVHRFPEGDSPQGLRQLIGNCWEWTRSDFKPFPGFEPDFYRQYSRPWMGSRKVLRGGSWMTRSRLIRNGYRNFFTPDRNDIPAGFRTCSPN